ncbi:hypothetical protein [Ignavibacterium sp.]|uniref:hypothetical protein n=1 Tax=Ignavibacterium sp. TaxID=2651167 RepID=UPI00307FC981
MNTGSEMTERTIKYFDGELSSVEKEKLLSELESNAELKKEFEEVSKVFDLKAQMTNQVTDREYLKTIIPKFRKRISSSKGSIILKPAFTLITLFLILAAGLVIFIPEKQSLSESTLSYFTDEELMQYLPSDYLDVVESEKIDSLFSEELRTDSDKIASYVFNGDDINNLYQKSLLTQEDEQEIYLALIERKF